MSAEELRAAFALLADPVVPEPDPYGRLLARARRARWHRWSGWGSAMVAAIVAVLLGTLALQGSGAPHPTPPPRSLINGGWNITPWIRRLLETPPRGALAKDPAFVAALTTRLDPHVVGLPPNLDQRTVLFGADAGGYRAVLVVFHSDTRQSAVWLVADAGTDPAVMAEAANPASTTSNGHTIVLPEGLNPYTTVAVSDPDGRRLAVGLAPAGCRIATLDADHPVWKDAATGDYIVRTDSLAVDNSTSVRVTCDSTVYLQAPMADGQSAASLAERLPSPPAEVDAALVGVRGTVPPREQVDTALNIRHWSSTPLRDCRVLFAERAPGKVASSPIPNGDVQKPPLLVLACTTAHGNTLLAAIPMLADSRYDFAGYLAAVSRTRYTDPDAILSVRTFVVRQTETGTGTGPGNMHEVATLPADRVLVLAPRNATRLQILQGGRVTGSVPLTDGIGSITVPAGNTVAVRALDRSGAVVGSGTAPTGEDIPEETEPTVPPINEWYS
jgi:hypothetical protein